MKKMIFTFALFFSLLSGHQLTSQCCRGYLNIGGCLVLSGVYIKVGLVCSGNPNGWCAGSMTNYCTGQYYSNVSCTNVTFTTSYETNC